MRILTRSIIVLKSEDNKIFRVKTTTKYVAAFPYNKSHFGSKSGTKSLERRNQAKFAKTIPEHLNWH